jgi:hypothetical protein
MEVQPLLGHPTLKTTISIPQWQLEPLFCNQIHPCVSTKSKFNISFYSGIMANFRIKEVFLKIV